MPDPTPTDTGELNGWLSGFLEQQRFRAVRRYLQGVRVLDVGCGPGNFSKLLARDIEYTGVDSSPAAVALARQRYPERQFHCLDLTVTLPAGQYDNIVMAACLEHFAQPALVLRRLATILAPDGRMLITIPGAGTAWLLSAGGRLGILDHSSIRKHERLPTDAELLGWLQAAGLQVPVRRMFLAGLNRIVVARS